MSNFKDCSVPKRPLERYFVKSAYFTREECMLQTQRVHASDMKSACFTREKYSD